MKIILDQPLCIHEIGRRPMQQDSVVPAFGEAQSTDRHFMVGEGPVADVYAQKSSLTLSSKGIIAQNTGNCRIYQIRPGDEEPVLSVSGDTNRVIEDVQTGDWLVIMTDGMCEYIVDEDIVGILNRPDWTPEHKKDALLDYTSENEDNHSAYILHIRGIEEEPIAEEPVAEKPVMAQEAVAAVAESNGFELTAKTVLVVLAAAYMIALIAGFFIGLFG